MKSSQIVCLNSTICDSCNYLDQINVIKPVLMKLTIYMSECSTYFGDIYNVAISRILMIVFEHYGTSTTLIVTSKVCDKGRRWPLCLYICGYGGS